MSAPAEHADHFESMEQQSHAARLGMWVFLASEVLLFAALFALYSTYRTHEPAAFREAIAGNTKTLGSINTGVLLVSSTFVALGVHAIRHGRRLFASGLVSSAIVLGGVFLAIKLTEYSHHFDEGIYPGGVGRYFVEHGLRGQSEFWTLYYAMTGLHAIHVTIGMTLLALAVLGIMSGRIAKPTSHRLAVVAIYWHLVDLVWIFLWPLFYLA